MLGQAPRGGTTKPEKARPLPSKVHPHEGDSDCSAGWWTEQGQLGQPGVGAIFRGNSRSLYRRGFEAAIYLEVSVEAVFC